MLDVIKANIKKRGFKKFVNRSVLFLAILLIEVIVLSTTIDYKHTDLTKVFIFTETHFVVYLLVLIFGIMAIRDLFNVKAPKKFDSKKFSILMAVNIISVFTYYKLNKFFMASPETVQANPFLYVPLWYINGIVMVVTLLFACYSSEFVKYFTKKFKMQLIASTALSILFYIGLVYSQKLWPFFSKIVAKSVYWLLNIFFEGAVYREGVSAPIIGIPAVTARVYAPCSGIEGMGLFTILFAVLFVTEYKKLDKKRALILLPLGIIGAFAINILRTFLIFVAGHFTSAEFAVGAFHSNVGWIAFTLYFLVFIYFAYPWMRKK